MNTFYRRLIPIALWLGIAVFLLALLAILIGKPIVFGLTVGGINRGAQTLLLVAVAAYCAHRAARSG